MFKIIRYDEQKRIERTVKKCADLINAEFRLFFREDGKSSQRRSARGGTMKRIVRESGFSQFVGWVEPFAKPIDPRIAIDGIASLHPSYGCKGFRLQD